MEIVKRYIVGIVLLVIVAIIWVGLLVASDKMFSDLNPNASTYTKSLQKSFDLETLNKVSDRTTTSFPVLPSEFFKLKGD